ncbi:hypothetical protein ACJJTC_006947 [Scirpophaga incertulas]
MHCCIPGCTNTSKKYSKSNGVKFYYFPRKSIHMPWLREKRQKWINAVKKHMKHSNNWLPSKNTTICSAYFIGNKKSENPTHPSYVPTIFQGEENNPQNQVRKLQRFKRHKRRMHQANIEKLNIVQNSSQEFIAESDVISKKLAKRSFSCQCDDLLMRDQTYDTTYLFCNLANLNGICTAEIQVNIVSTMLVNKSCEANIPVASKVMKDFSCDPLDQQFTDVGLPGIPWHNFIKNRRKFHNFNRCEYFSV